MSAKPLALVVEDSEDQAGLMREHLERADYDVVSVGSAEGASALLPEIHPTLAVVDLLLPGRGGDVFAEELRESRPECFLAISSVLDVSSYPPADAFLPKPFSGAQLRSIAAQARVAR